MPGIGNSIAATLIGDLPELGSLNRREIASLTASLPLIATAASFGGVSAAAALTVVPRSTSARWAQVALIPTSNASTNA